MLFTDESGQAHVVEAVAASVLILTTVIFAIQATAITPLTVSTSNQHIETQDQRVADGVLSNAQAIEIEQNITGFGQSGGGSGSGDGGGGGDTQSYGYTCEGDTTTDGVTAVDNSPGAKTTHIVSENVSGNLVGDSLNEIFVKYTASNASDVPDSSLDSIETLGLDKNNDGVISDSESIIDDVQPSEFLTENGGKTLKIEFQGNYNLEPGDQLVYIYNRTVNPSTDGDYSVEVDVNAGTKSYNEKLVIESGGESNCNEDDGTTSTTTKSKSEVLRDVDALREAVLYWNSTQQQFYNSSAEGYKGRYPGNKFGEILSKTFTDRDIATNVYITYSRPDGGSNTERMVYMGSPSNNAVTATKNIVIYDNHPLTAPNESVTVGGTNKYFAKNVNPDSNVYNVFEVRIVVLRI